MNNIVKTFHRGIEQSSNLTF